MVIDRLILLVQEAQELLPEAPPEAAKVLASLLATDPGARSTKMAEQLELEPGKV